MRELFYVLICGVLLVSCTSDDNNETRNLAEKILENSWFFQRHGETCSNGFDLDEGDPFEFRFLSDNTVVFNNPGYLTSSSYLLNVNELTLETIYTLPSGNKRKFVGNYIFSEDKFTGNNTFTAYNDIETLWTCNGTTSIFR